MQHSRRKIVEVVATVVAIFAANVLSADSVTLIPTEDATISEKSLDMPLGGQTTLDSGTTGPNEGLKMNRALLKFDVAASIPTNATVTSVALTMTVVQAPTATNLWFSLHKVLKGWSESVVTWTNRLSPAAPWSAPGGAEALDYSSSVAQSNFITGTGTFTFTSSSSLVADVQDWVSNPATNFGWILICEQEDLERSVRKFASRESSTATNRPSLEVHFTRPTSPTLTVIPTANGNFQFFFNVESNRNYSVLRGGDCAATNWTIVTNITPLLAPTNVLVTEPLLTDSNRFYRVLAL